MLVGGKYCAIIVFYWYIVLVPSVATSTKIAVGAGVRVLFTGATIHCWKLLFESKRAAVPLK
jgi:hypothetical protein